MKQITRPCRILWNLQRQRNMLMFTPETVVPILTLPTNYVPLEVFFFSNLFLGNIEDSKSFGCFVSNMKFRNCLQINLPI